MVHIAEQQNQYRIIHNKINHIHQGRIQDFNLGGGAALKKIAPSGGRCEHIWGISCEKSRFSPKKSYFFQFQGGARAGCASPLNPPLYTHRYPICGPPPFFKFYLSNSLLLCDVFIINSVEQLLTLPKTQSEIDISPFLKTQKPSILYSIILI